MDAEELEGHLYGLGQDELAGVFEHVSVPGYAPRAVYVFLLGMAREEDDRDFAAGEDLLGHDGPVGHAGAEIDIHEDEIHVLLGDHAHGLLRSECGFHREAVLLQYRGLVHRDEGLIFDEEDGPVLVAHTVTPPPGHIGCNTNDYLMSM